MTDSPPGRKAERRNGAKRCPARQPGCAPSGPGILALRPTPGLVLIVVASVLGAAVFYCVKHLTADAHDFKAWLLAVGGLTTLALAGLVVTPQSLTLGLRVFFRIVALVPIIFFVFATPEFTGIDSRSTGSAFEIIRYFGLATGLLSLWRPSFLSASLYALVLTDQIAAVAGGLPVSETDMLPTIETTSVLLFALTAARWISLTKRTFGTQLREVFGGSVTDPALRMPFQEALLILVTAVHLANYYYSGHTKLVLSGGPTNWLLHNPTGVLMENAWDMGFLPIAQWKPLADFILLVATRFTPAVNAFVLGIQLLAFVALFRRRWLIAALLSYDMMHIGIFLLSGIFFWKWIALNTAFVAALTRARMSEISGRIAIAAVVCGALAPLMFFVARLGWYDTREVSNSYAVAITNDGKEFAVPSNYFLALSLGFAQMDFGQTQPGTSPATSTWGATVSDDIMRQANKCQAPVGGEGSPERLANLERVLRMVHETAVAAGGADGVFNYNIYPHHVWSNLFSDTAFLHLDKRKIVAYRWVEEVLCVDHLHNATRVMTKRSTVVPVAD